MSSISLNDIPLSLYVHIPWCVKKCPYCDFNSHEKNASYDESAYVSALLLDLEAEHRRTPGRTLQSIFFGGGTPSLFSADSIYKIIDYAQQRFKFNDIEITLEANPGTFEQEKFKNFKSAGINRLSIGIQSFHAAHLKTLERIHDSQQALAAIDTAQNAGLENINLDLMFGLPQQTISQAIDDIKTACSFEVPHISHYQLTIEENTYFHKHRPTLPGDDFIWEMQTLCQQALADNQYRQYEISAYSQAHRQSLHNTNYWKFGDYIGIGAGAHGKLSCLTTEKNNIQIIRQWKHRQPQQYIKHTQTGNAISGEQILTQNDILFEFLLNALRLKKGVDLSTFSKHTGLKFEQLKETIQNVEPSLLRFDKNKIVTSDQGFLFLNDILENLISD